MHNFKSLCGNKCEVWINECLMWGMDGNSELYINVLKHWMPMSSLWPQSSTPQGACEQSAKRVLVEVHLTLSNHVMPVPVRGGGRMKPSLKPSCLHATW